MLYFISPLSIDAFTSPPNPTSLQYICSSLGLTYCSIYVLFILILPSICRINHVYNPPSTHFFLFPLYRHYNPSHKSFTSTISFSEQGTPTSKHYVNLRYHGNSLPRHVHFPYRYVLRGPTMASSNISCYAFFVHNPRNVLCVNSKPSHKERTLCARSRLHCNVFFSTHVKINKYTKGDWRESYIIT